MAGRPRSVGGGPRRAGVWRWPAWACVGPGPSSLARFFQSVGMLPGAGGPPPACPHQIAPVGGCLSPGTRGPAVRRARWRSPLASPISSKCGNTPRGGRSAARVSPPNNARRRVLKSGYQGPHGAPGGGGGPRRCHRGPARGQWPAWGPPGPGGARERAGSRSGARGRAQKPRGSIWTPRFPRENGSKSG